MNVHAARGVAVREFKLAPSHGSADYLLFVDARAVGVLEAKPAGHTLRGVEPQTDRYATGLPAVLKTPIRPLPFQYISTGEETCFTNLLDPHPRSRPIFHVHRPDTLGEWLVADSLIAWTRSWAPVPVGAEPALADVAYRERPASLRIRLQHLPEPALGGLWPNQALALRNLEQSLVEDRRAWTPDLLWRAYELLDRDSVRGASARRLLTDIVSLLRFALHRDAELVPHAERVRDQFQRWLAQQQSRGRVFTPTQVHWLEMIRDHIATSVEIAPPDFDLTPFTEAGGLGRARQVFGATR